MGAHADDAAWIRVCRDGEIAEGEPRVLAAGDRDVYLVRIDGVVRAVGTECPHYHEQLVKGVILDREIVCPAHFARFDVRNGRMVSPPALDDLPRFPVEIRDGDVWVGPVEKPRFPKPAGDDPRTFLIVGGGAAGEAAAETLRREGFAGRIVMITAEDERPYDRPNLSKDLLTGAAKPEWMPLRGPKFHANQKIELLTGRRVIAVDPAAKTATLSTGEKLAFDRALIATGGVPRKPAIPGADAGGCFLLRSLADGRALIAAASAWKRAVLVGAGFIGMELASSLAERGLRVQVVAPEPLPFAKVLGDRIATMLLERQKENGVEFHLGTIPVRVTGTPGEMRVGLSDGGAVSGAFVVFGLGIEPAIDCLAGTGLAGPDGIPVDARFCTRHPDIFAAGDVAIAPDVAGEVTRVEHWAVAQRQGRHAARAMLGSPAPYGEAHFFWTRQAGIPLKYVGAARTWDEIIYRGDVGSAKFLAGFYRAGGLKAAATVGRRIELAAVERLMRIGCTPSRAQFADETFDLVAEAKSATPPAEGASHG
jgi:NADPH-dependent 2,4-dienoyl-CoA reductase/sulfur reductase-like enzyme/nitrite reductase/ring-hydroxylating ferredoxin subunit